MLRMEGQSLYYDGSRETGCFLKLGMDLVHLELKRRLFSFSTGRHIAKTLYDDDFWIFCNCSKRNDNNTFHFRLFGGEN